MITPGNYFDVRGKKQKKVWVTLKSKIIFLNVGLFFPAVAFWVSVLFWVSLGTDYLFDVVINNLQDTFLGQIGIVFLVVILPVIAIVINQRFYKKYQEIAAKICMIFGGVLALGGVWVALAFR